MQKKLFTLFEILIWAVLFFVPLLFVSSLLHPDLAVKKNYSAYFYDINGIIVGSPINFIGYNVGYVKTITVEDGKVKLDLAITKKDFELPRCTDIKIEESGLGGSRSLEVSPCEDLDKAPGIYTKKAKKLDELLGDANDFSKSLTEGMGDLYIGLDATVGGKDHQDFVEIQEKLHTAESNLNGMSNDLVTARVKAQKNLPAINKTMESTLNIVSCAEINPQETKEKVVRNQKVIEQIGKNIKKHSPSEYKEIAKTLYWKSEYLKFIDKNKVHQNLEQINNILNSVQRIMGSIECNFNDDALQLRQQKMQNIKKDSEGLIKEDF